MLHLPYDTACILIPTAIVTVAGNRFCHRSGDHILGFKLDYFNFQHSTILSNSMESRFSVLICRTVAFFLVIIQKLIMTSIL